MPATLPITTDYLPDERSLALDYLVNEYDLSPETILVEGSNQHSPLEKPKLTTEEAFLEIVSQRLAQGFQLIIPPGKEDTKGYVCESQACSRTVSHGPTVSGTDMPRTKPASILASRKVSKPWAEYWLSIGRIFHMITLSYDQQNIKVKKYSPSNPYKSIKIHYRYRFQAPDNDTFDLSWVDFTFLKLENFNWNHMDHYVLTQGDREFLLTDGLKYWRFRLYVLPSNFYVPYTRQIAEDSNPSSCDTYPTSWDVEYDSEISEGFLRFAETCMNRSKRQLASFRPTVPLQRSVQVVRQGFRNRASTSAVAAMAGTHVTDRGRTASSSGTLPSGPLQRLRRESGGGASPALSHGSSGLVDLANR